jgi:mRNA interferase RelE/StbE
MRTAFRKSFERDLKKIKGRDILKRVREAIEQVEAADTLQEIHDLKKMKGGDNFFRIRIGEYRIGIAVEGETVEFIRCLPRKDLYRYFP